MIQPGRSQNSRLIHSNLSRADRSAVETVTYFCDSGDSASLLTFDHGHVEKCHVIVGVELLLPWRNREGEPRRPTLQPLPLRKKGGAVVG